ncbi:HNH endonuclease [Ralstonia phage phiRSL1]|uniref:HNH endonuclease n=1 Tax=Ralstonia phage phiRSL1 TaxID=1980924 RepID=B2ZYK2_9CAUD|nr:HNH endonuclease [Ralstonia phage phiRSL1]BAG41778.1 HNH endonuclease [Ralstonia phage phiRSL1]
MKRLTLPSHEYLSQCFSFTKSTGSLRWKNRPPEHFQSVTRCLQANTRYAGKEAGCLMVDGHIGVRLDGKLYYAHRIIWMLVTGVDPGILEVDHKNMDKADNRWRNLRLATHEQQSYNVLRHSGNTSGVKGVSFNKRTSKWIALVQGRRRKIRKEFALFAEAVAAVRAARKQVHKRFTNHG